MSTDLSLEAPDDADLDPVSRAARSTGRLALWSLAASGAAIAGMGLSVLFALGALIVGAIAAAMIVVGVIVFALLAVLAAALLIVGSACALVLAVAAGLLASMLRFASIFSANRSASGPRAEPSPL